MSDPSLKTRVRMYLAAGARRMAPATREGEFGILVYHRVTAAEPRGRTPTWNVTPARLRQQLGGLLKAGYTPWPLRELLAAHDDGERIPPRTFAVTFDDGYANNRTRALPILEELSVPATIFLSTGFLDSTAPFPNEDWELAGSPEVDRESWLPLTTEEVEELIAHPLLEIGCHTHSHRDFRASPEEMKEDLALSTRLLRERFGVERASFAFPYGYTTPELFSVVRAAGLRCALTTRSEPVRRENSPFGWGRFTAFQEDSPATLMAKLDGWFTRLGRRQPSLSSMSAEAPSAIDSGSAGSRSAE